MSLDHLDLTLLDGIPDDERDLLMMWRTRVQGTNISERTLLATDYLNHFNEIVMLLELVPDMPDLLEECLQWKSCSYVDHFRNSGFSDRELAIAAYHAVPSKFRLRLEDLIHQMEVLVAFTLQHLGLHREDWDEARWRFEVKEAVGAMQRITQAMNGIIHGETPTMAQQEIDGFLDAAPAV